MARVMVCAREISSSKIKKSSQKRNDWLYKHGSTSQINVFERFDENNVEILDIFFIESLHATETTLLFFCAFN